MTVYADLFIVNLYIDALLLSAVRRFLRLPLTGKRLLLASVLGGVFGLSALLPALPGVVLFPLALLESLALCAAAFAPKPSPDHAVRILVTSRPSPPAHRGQISAHVTGESAPPAGEVQPVL